MKMGDGGVGGNSGADPTVADAQAIGLGMDPSGLSIGAMASMGLGGESGIAGTAPSGESGPSSGGPGGDVGGADLTANIPAASGVAESTTTPTIPADTKTERKRRRRSLLSQEEGGVEEGGGSSIRRSILGR